MKNVLSPPTNVIKSAVILRVVLRITGIFVGRFIFLIFTFTKLKKYGIVYL